MRIVKLRFRFNNCVITVDKRVLWLLMSMIVLLSSSTLMVYSWICTSSFSTCLAYVDWNMQIHWSKSINKLLCQALVQSYPIFVSRFNLRQEIEQFLLKLWLLLLRPEIKTNFFRYIRLWGSFSNYYEIGTPANVAIVQRVTRKYEVR